MPIPSVSDINSIPTRWSGVNNATNGIAEYFAGQQKKVQDLQLQQAQDLSKFKTLDQVYYGGQHGPMIDQVLAQNPYGKRLLGGQGQQPQYPQGQPNGVQPMGGIANGMAMIGMNGGTPAPGSSVMPQGGWGSPAMAGQFNPIGGGGNGTQPSNAPVVTGGSTTQKAFEAPSFTQSFTNPQAEAQVSGAKEFAGKMGGEQAQAQTGTIRDNNQLMMTAQSLQNLNNLHKELSDSGFAGNVYAGTRAESAKFIPKAMGLQQKVVPDDVQGKVGQFVSARNEAVTKMQPFFSQQFGVQGTSRIMDSLLQLAQNEVGSLDTPHAQFEGQVKGTLKSLYRIQQASQAYENELKASGQQLPADPNLVTEEIYKRMPQLSNKQNKELDGLITSTLGKEEGKSNAGGGQFNPVGKAQEQKTNQPPSYNSKTQKLQKNTRTGEYRVVNL